MAFTPRTPEQRADDLVKAQAARTARAEVKTRLKAGTTTLSEVIDSAGSDPVVAKTKVAALVQAMPGVGKVRATQIMQNLGIDVSRRVQGLGPIQRAALLAEFAA